MTFFATVADVDENQEGRLRLGEAVKSARSRKHRTIENAKTAAGISRGAWEKVERGDPVRPYTLAAVEVALDWPAGRAQEFIDAVGRVGGDVDREAEIERLRADLERIRQRLDELAPPAVEESTGA